jgi:hypothetical protein
MPTAEAHVPTERASRYLQQLCSHASRMRHGRGLGRGHGRGHAGPSAEATSDTTGRITRGTAICDLTATPTGLTLRASAEDEEQLRGLQEAVTRTLERVGRRDGLIVDWR